MQNSIPDQNCREYTVWDPFMGIGTTGVACAEMGCCIFYSRDEDANLMEDVSSRVATVFLGMWLFLIFFFYFYLLIIFYDST